MVVWNVGLNGLGQAGLILATAVAVPLLVRTLGSERYGVLNVVLVVVAYLGNLDLGLARGATKFMAEANARGAREEAGATFWMAVRIVLLLGVVAAAALTLAAPFLAGRVFRIPASLSQEAESALRAAAVVVVANVVSLVLAGALEARQRFDLVNALRVPSALLGTLLPLFAALLGMRLPGILWLLAFKSVLFLGAYLLLCGKAIPEIRGEFPWSRALATRLMSFGGWTMIVILAYMALGSADRLLIAALLDMRTVTLYAIPQQIINALSALLFAVRPVLFATFSSLFASDPARIEALHRRAAECISLLMGLVCLLLAACADELLRLWMGGGFEASARILEISCVGAFLFSIASVSSELLQATRYVRTLVAILAALVAFQGLLLWLLLGRFGLAGAAWAYVATQALSVVLLVTAAARLGLVRPGRLLPSRTLATCALLGALGPVVLVAKRSLAPRAPVVFASALLFAVAYLIIVWSRILEPETRLALRSAVERFGRARTAA